MRSRPNLTRIIPNKHTVDGASILHQLKFFVTFFNFSIAGMDLILSVGMQSRLDM